MTAVRLDLCRGLSEDDAARVIALGIPRALPRGSVLFDLGENADRIFQVTRGCVTLSLPMQIRGKVEDVLIEERLPGETVGWSGLIPPHRFTLKAVAAAESEVLAFPRAALLAHFEAHPAVAAAVVGNVAAVIGHRLHIFQAMWLREIQRTVDRRFA